MMGGVEFDIDGSTASPGLYAAGEDCGGVHGANRLGGNGVANSTVYGGIAGAAMARFVATNRQWRDPDTSAIDAGLARAERPLGRPAGDLSGAREVLGTDMWERVGILRTADGLLRAERQLESHSSALVEVGVPGQDRAFNLSWHDWLNLDSLLTISRVIAAAALAREDSRGAHFRKDFPETGDLSTSAYTRIKLDGDGLVIESVPVDFEIVKPGESLIDDEAATAAAARPLEQS